MAAASSVLALCVLTSCSSSTSSNGSVAAGGGANGSAPTGTTKAHTGNDPNPASKPAGCAPDVVPRICVTVNLAGQTSVVGKSATFAPAPPDATPSTTCVDLAKGSDGDLPLGASVRLGAKDVQWDMTVTSYGGPGAYHPVDVSLTAGGHSYFAESKSQVKVDVAHDFGTTLTLSGLQESGVGPGKISGTVQWTCVNAG